MRFELTTSGLLVPRADQLRHNCLGSKQVMRFELNNLRICKPTRSPIAPRLLEDQYYEMAKWSLYLINEDRVFK